MKARVDKDTCIGCGLCPGNSKCNTFLYKPSEIEEKKAVKRESM